MHGKPFNDRKYLGFEQLTHVPIQKALIDRSLLTPAEVTWLDAYHSRVWERVAPKLPPGSEAAEWLRRATTPLIEGEGAADASTGAAKSVFF